MGNELIIGLAGERAVLRPLLLIEDCLGNLRHALKASDETFKAFGEAYFTSVAPGAVKGWKKHTRMQMHLVVPLGNVRFYLRTEAPNALRSVVIGEGNYQRLVVDPGIWVAFEAVGAETHLILNVASIEHDPNEAVNVPLSTYLIG